MSKFAKYAVRVDDTVKKIFQEIQATESAYETAKRAMENGPRIRPGAYGQDVQEMAKAARLEADYREAKAALESARRSLPMRGEQELKAIRAELAGAIDSTYTIDPAQVDAVALKLMESGICTSKDYEKLMADAERKSNQTMIRLIASHAGKSYEDAQAKADQDPYGQRDQVELGRLYEISRTGRDATERDLLGAFDGMADTFQRAMNNTDLIGYWDQLMGPIIENF